MTLKKLSESDKREIIELYRTTGETTSTLADRYGVSNSTISRMLKSTLQEDEYEVLISSKRAARTPGKDTIQTSLFPSEVNISQPETLVEVKQSPENEPEPSSNVRWLRRRSSASSKPETEMGVKPEVQPEVLKADSVTPKPITQPVNQVKLNQPLRQPEPIEKFSTQEDSSVTGLDEDDLGAEASALAQMLGEDLLDDSDLDEDEDLEDLEEDDLDDDTPILRRRVASQALIQVLPLSQATLPKTCYLVIDRAAELITRPLRDFGDLGQIPSQEFQQKTLPVFDNHRVARRFSTKRDKVIKVPDSKVLHKTRSHLEAKGITRLLVDGQVYSLSK